MYFDVEYKNPQGIKGTHYAVKADSVEEAALISPIYITYSSLFKPEDFTVLSVKPSEFSPE